MCHLNKLPLIGYECPTYTTFIEVNKNVPLIVLIWYECPIYTIFNGVIEKVPLINATTHWV